MGLWQRLFGSRVEAIVVDDAGRRRYRKLSPERIERLRGAGYGVVRLDRVPVHMLDAVQGPSQTEWEVGKDVTREVVERHADPETGALYAVRLYEGLEPRDTKITSRAKWQELRESMDR